MCMCVLTVTPRADGAIVGDGERACAGGRLRREWEVAKLTLPRMSAAMEIDDLSPAQMKSLLLKCHNEQRPPRADELCLWKPAMSARRDTGLFDLMDDDLLTEILVRLPVKRRILFVVNVCKQFAYLATQRKLFRTLYLVREPMSLPRHLAEDEDVLLNVTDEMGSWRLFADSLEELCIADKDSSSYQTRVQSVPSCHLKNLVSLTLYDFDNKKHKLTLTKLLMFIDLCKLRELKLGYPLEGNEWTRRSSVLLKATCNLERLEITDLETLHIDGSEFSKILDAWWTAHGGVPPLRYLCTQNVEIVKLSLQRLDLEDLVVDSVLGRFRITKDALTNQWMLSIYWDLLDFDEDGELSDFTTLLQCVPGLSAHVTMPYEHGDQLFVDVVKAKLMEKYPHLTFGTEKIA